MSAIRGENAILYWKVDGYFRPIACMEECNVTTNTELSETSTVQTGTSRTYRGNRNTWTVSARGICSFDQNHPHVKLRQLEQAMTPVPIIFQAIDDNGITETFSGNVLITSLPNDAAAGDFYSYSIEATGTGPYVLSDVPVDPNECCQDAWEYYTGNGTEGFSITITNLIGKDISGRIYRDGIEYRPSGTDHDGSGTPHGKEFKYEKPLGRVSFDTSLPEIALGEPIDIPYNICGEIEGCSINITNVAATVEDDGKFHLTFLPVIGADIMAPDDVTVRYSADGGETWSIPDSITYDPDTNYQEVVINDDLDTDQDYIFEITPVCNDTNGTSGTGTYIPCTPVGITPTTLPDAMVGVPYNESIPLTGTAPFVIGGSLSLPAGLEASILGSSIVISGTPTEAGTGVLVRVNVINCFDETALFTDTIDITEPSENATIANQLTDVLVEDIIFDGSTCTPYVGIPTAYADSGMASIPIGISSTITVRFNAVPLAPLHLEVKINGVLQETKTESSSFDLVIVSNNPYTINPGDVVALRVY